MKIRMPLFTLSILLLLLLSACSSTDNKHIANPTHTAVPRQASATPTSVPTPIATAVPTAATITTDTTCPTAGTGRAAITPSFQLGSDQNVVYLSNSADGGSGPSGGGLFFLKRYDVTTRATSVILNLRGNEFETAQLSLDGQRVLFTSLVNNTSEIQLVRMDGQYLQTLYCAPVGQQIDPTHTTGMQWSPDQQQIIFNQGASPSSPQSIYLLQLSNGKVQRELTTKGTDLQFMPRTWLDNLRVFITDTGGSNVLLLDTSKGPDQNYHSMQRIIGPHDPVMDFDSSYDASNIFVSTYLHQGIVQCEIYIHKTSSFSSIKSMSCSQLPVFGLRVIGKSSASLLLEVYNNSGSPQNGLWKINTDGTGLVQLTNVAHGFTGSLCPFTQYPWSNFSRNGSFYTDFDAFGSLNGGSLTPYTTNFNIRLVGWTTM